MSIKAILKGSAIALGITFLTILIMAAVMYFSSIDESVINIGVYIGTAAGVIVGAIGTARGSNGKVLINCLVTALIYLLVTAVMTLIINGGFTFNYHFFIVVAAVILCSVFGAIIGR